MDKAAAIELCTKYLYKVKENGITFYQAWIFGSFAKGHFHEYSDIDLALVLPENIDNFNTEIRLMTIRSGEETIIEPHTFNPDDFTESNPLVYQIIHTGLLLEM